MMSKHSGKEARIKYRVPLPWTLVDPLQYLPYCYVVGRARKTLEIMAAAYKGCFRIVKLPYHNYLERLAVLVYNVTLHKVPYKLSTHHIIIDLTYELRCLP